MGKRKFKVKRSLAGLGLFAAENVSEGDFVIEYTGEKITHAQANERRGKYLFTLNSRYVIDGRGRKNLARYINHSCEPNCEVIIEGSEINVYAVRSVKPGEELTYDYGQEYFKEYIEPRGCRCAHCAKK
ncbi:MAG: SET domain-containing protein [Candidatus Moranbacteria bacterium GW2011_GWE1_49_15]|nr:MAG: SET domain-containing protein [Candidatus Moranbacteria bacterium GW2011_GWE1_49_15]HBP01381.1 SET domain-containing protein-lysine N-methyltransferase [Candidatus Moranbacteria bacterium]